MKGNDIAVIGMYPPPIGGVSIHVERLTKYLKENNKNFILYDTSKMDKDIKINYECIRNMKLWLIKYLFTCNDKIIHLHEKNWYIVAIICFIAKAHKSKVILTVHSFREEPFEFNFIKKFAFKYSIKNLDYLISVGENEKNKLIKYGCKTDKIYLIPAYIHPEYEKNDDLLIPNYTWEFINNKSFIICANASKLSFYNNEDLYGLDMCVELCYKLKIKYKDKKIGFIFCLPDVGDYEYYEKVQKRTNELKINNEFLLVNEKIPLYPILKKSNLFIRPTNTDGDAVSIREALYYKVPAIASDVVKRPEDAVLFKSRDMDDLYNKTVDVIENHDSHKDKLKDVVIEDNAEKIMNVYKEVMKR
jgi:hypothetical protein